MNKLNLSTEAQATMARLEEIRDQQHAAEITRGVVIHTENVPALLELVDELRAECERLTTEYVKAEVEVNYWRERYCEAALQRDALKPEHQLRVGVRVELAALLGTNDIAEAVKEVKRLKGLKD